MFGFAVLLAVAGVLALLPRLRDAEREELNERARSRAPGKFLALSEGQVHYELAGPQDGEVVVLLPGISLAMYVFDALVPRLTARGYRVLRYDLYGRGYSDRPVGDYGPERFERQLLEVLSALGIRGPVHLVGLALGALIGVQFAARHPEQVRSLGLLTPDGFGTELPLSARIARIPLVGGALGHYLFRVLGDRTMLSRLRRYTSKPVPELEPLMRESLRYRGFKRAVLSSLRHQMPIENAAGTYAEVSRLGIPTCFLWGEEDQVTSPALIERIRQVMPRALFRLFPGAGHLPHCEQPEAVAEALVEGFRASVRY
jgi:pimeloyl-ACP methyl ester carboxylesterase